jgi:hypothetical protein
MIGAQRMLLGGGGITSLTQIPGLALWYDTADLATMTIDGLNRISSILNKGSLSNATATQSTNGYKPTFVSPGVIRFTAASTQYLNIGAGAFGLTNNIAALTVLATYKRITTQVSTQYIFYASTGGGGTRFGTSINTASNIKTITERRLDADGASSTSFGADDGVAHALVAIQNWNGPSSGLSSMYLDGSLISEQASGTRGLTSAVNSTSLYIGGVGVANSADMQLGQIAVWPRKVPPSEISAAVKWCRQYRPFF